MSTAINESIFASAHAALMFAFNFAPDQYPPSVIGKLIAGGTLGNGKGLVGMDGAGQAGMILAEVHGLGVAAEHFLAARFSPHHVPCACRQTCCAGYKPARTFSEAIYWVTEAAVSQLAGHSVNYRLRRGLVLRYFGERENMTELAKFAGVTRDLASDHNAKLLPWLKHGDGASLHAATYALKSAGIVE